MNNLTASKDSKPQVAENSKINRHCVHNYQQVPRCNLAKCAKCGGVRYRKNYERQV